MDVPLDLPSALTARIRLSRRKGKLILGVVSRPVVVNASIAAFVRSPSEVVMRAGGCSAARLDIDIVAVPSLRPGDPTA